MKSFLIATQAELLKTKRTASFWLSLCGAAFIPTIFFIMCTFVEREPVKDFLVKAWTTFFIAGWQILSIFLLPMYTILLCALIPQIENRNNTWKQVFASPQSIGQIFFAKFLTVHLMIILFCLLLNGLMILSGLTINVIKPGYTFLKQKLDWSLMMQLNGRTYISALGFSAMQFWLGLRFKNFIAPMGIGLAVLVGGIVAIDSHWKHVDKVPHAYPALTFISIEETSAKTLQKHELNSIGYFIVFTTLACLDLRFRKEKG